MLNLKAQTLREDCQQLDLQLGLVKKHNNELTRLLKNTVYEEDLIVVEMIDLTLSTDEFVAFIGPLLKSHKWAVDGKHDVKAFVRTFHSVFRVHTAHDKGWLAEGTIENLIRNYLDQNK